MSSAATIALSLVCGGCGGGGGGEPAPPPPTIQPGAQIALPVFLVLGQSNAFGNGKISDLQATWWAPQPNTEVLRDNVWPLLEPGVLHPEFFGPEIAFGARAGKSAKVGIIKIAVPATNLATDWSPQVAGSLHFRVLDVVQSARTTRQIRIAGVLWMQGESDATNAAMAAQYGANLTAFIQSLRRDIGDQSLPFAVCRVNPPVNDGFPYAAEVRAGQQGITLAGYTWFDCDELSLGPDRLHFDTAGQVVLGNLFADAMVRLGAIQ